MSEHPMESGGHTMSDERLSIPSPSVRPFQLRLDKPEYVQEVWNAFVKPEQDAEIPPSVEMRMLMAILRAVHDGLSSTEEAT